MSFKPNDVVMLSLIKKLLLELFILKIERAVHG
jgi:hypothetical protein